MQLASFRHLPARIFLKPPPGCCCNSLCLFAAGLMAGASALCVCFYIQMSVLFPFLKIIFILSLLFTFFYGLRIVCSLSGVSGTPFTLFYLPNPQMHVSGLGCLSQDALRNWHCPRHCISLSSPASPSAASLITPERNRVRYLSQNSHGDGKSTLKGFLYTWIS